MLRRLGWLALMIGACTGGEAGTDSGSTSAAASTGTTDATSTPDTTSEPTTGASTTGETTGVTTSATTGPATTDGPDTSTTAPATSATSDDSGSSTGEPLGCPYLLCEDFEGFGDGQTPESALWSLNKADDSVLLVDSARPHGGARSLHVTTPPHPAQAYIRNTTLFPLAGNRMYGRVYYYIQGPEPTKFVHWNLIEGTGPAQVDGNNYTKLVRYGGVQLPEVFDRWIFNFEMWPHPPGFNEFGNEEMGNFPDADRWICVEWMFEGTDVPIGHLWRDGVEVESIAASSPIDDINFTFPEFDGINLGWSIYQDIDAPFDVWLDDIAIDDAPIGCLN